MKELLIWVGKLVGDVTLCMTSLAFVDAHPIILLFFIRVIGQRFYEVMKWTWIFCDAILNGKGPERLDATSAIVVWILKCLADVCIGVSLLYFLGWYSFALVLVGRLIVKRIYEVLITPHILSSVEEDEKGRKASQPTEQKQYKTRAQT